MSRTKVSIGDLQALIDLPKKMVTKEIGEIADVLAVIAEDLLQTRADLAFHETHSSELLVKYYELLNFIKSECQGFIEGFNDDAVPVMTAMSIRAGKLLTKHGVKNES